MKIPYIPAVDAYSLASIEQALQSLESHQVDNCNWPEDFPYAPEFSFKAFHNGSHLILAYSVREKYTAARVTEDFGEVWTDSCAEFFFKPDGSSRYYNLEATCAGKLLLARRSGRNDPERASAEVMASILRYPSLGSDGFDEIIGNNSWTLVLAIPAGAWFAEGLDSYRGLRGSFNAYKCGDNLSEPHFLSYFPIKTEKPDFHRPEFFGPVEFE